MLKSTKSLLFHFKFGNIVPNKKKFHVLLKMLDFDFDLITYNHLLYGHRSMENLDKNADFSKMFYKKAYHQPALLGHAVSRQKIELIHIYKSIFIIKQCFYLMRQTIHCCSATHCCLAMHWRLAILH